MDHTFTLSTNTAIRLPSVMIMVNPPIVYDAEDLIYHWTSTIDDIDDFMFIY